MEKLFRLWRGTTKQNLMEFVYTAEELKNIDTAIPDDLAREIRSWWYVMNFNEPHQVFGKLEDMRVVAAERGLTLEY